MHHAGDNIGRREQQMTAEQRRPPAGAIGDMADRYGQHEIDRGRPHVEQRQHRGVESHVALEDQIDEGVADRRHAEHRGGHQERRNRACVRHAPGHGASARCMFDRGRIAHERQQHAETDDGDAEADDEHDVEALRHRRQNHQPDQRPEHRARAVERAMNAEGGSAIRAVGAERNQRVARRGPNALAESIERDDAGDERPGGPGQRHADSADG